MTNIETIEGRTGGTLLTDAIDAFVRMAPSSTDVHALTDDALLNATGLIAAARRELDTCAGWVAAEIGRRSDRTLGHTGLAQQQGFRNAESLVQSITGSTRADAITLVKVGTIVAQTEAADALARAIGDSSDIDPDSSSPELRPLLPLADPNWWRAGIGRAVSAGTLSYPQADAIRFGIGELSDTVTAEVLADAVTVLVDAATNPDEPLTVDELRKLSRQMRDSVDTVGLARREQAQQDAQYVKAWERADGMVAANLLLDREAGAFFLSIINELVSARRGGPRFVDRDDAAAAQRVIDDPRTTERIAVDGIMQLLRIGVDADPNTVYGTRKPAIRVIVTKDTITGTEASDHRGVLADTGESVTSGAVERNICTSGTITVTVDQHGNPLDVGREQRLFTSKQKLALAIRDGGCVIGGCDRPASWTEAHHIDHWDEHHGLTNLEDGILLCQFHHLNLHNNHWRILRYGDRYFLRRSREEDPEQTLIELHSKNPLTRLKHVRQQSSRPQHSDEVRAERQGSDTRERDPGGEQRAG